MTDDAATVRALVAALRCLQEDYQLAEVSATVMLPADILTVRVSPPAPATIENAAGFLVTIPDPEQ